MTAAAMMALDLAVSRGMRKRPGESLVEASLRALRTHSPVRRRLAAHVLLSAGKPWDNIARAAELLALRGRRRS